MASPFFILIDFRFDYLPVRPEETLSRSGNQFDRHRVFLGKRGEFLLGSGTTITKSHGPSHSHPVSYYWRAANRRSTHRGGTHRRRAHCHRSARRRSTFGAACKVHKAINCSEWECNHSNYHIACSPHYLS